MSPFAMKRVETMKTPEALSVAVQEYLGERWDQLAPSGDRSCCGRQFAWCDEVLEFLTEGLDERLAGLGVECRSPYPGPFRLWDEEQHPGGEHVRRFWTVVVESGSGRPVAKLCTYFSHRHDTAAIPRLPRVEGFPPDFRGDEIEAR